MASGFRITCNEGLEYGQVVRSKVYLVDEAAEPYLHAEPGTVGVVLHPDPWEDGLGVTVSWGLRGCGGVCDVNLAHVEKVDGELVTRCVDLNNGPMTRG